MILTIYVYVCMCCESVCHVLYSMVHAAIYFAYAQCLASCHWILQVLLGLTLLLLVIMPSRWMWTPSLLLQIQLKLIRRRVPFQTTVIAMTMRVLM